MNDFLKELFEYTLHFNDKVIDSLINNELKLTPQKGLQLLNHTINAQEVWNARINGEYCATGIWEIRPPETLKEINRRNYENSLQILENRDLQEVVSYRNSKGDSFSNTVQDILYHVVNHSTYHRGQIATDSKNSGLTPLVTDYIFYKRDAPL